MERLTVAVLMGYAPVDLDLPGSNLGPRRTFLSCQGTDDVAECIGADALLVEYMY